MSMPGVGGAYPDSGFGQLPPDQQRRIRMENEQWLKQPGNDFFKGWIAENAFGLGDPLTLNREAKKYDADAATVSNPNYQRYYDEVVMPINERAAQINDQQGPDAWIQFVQGNQPMSYQDWFAKNIQPTLNKPAAPVSRQPAPAVRAPAPAVRAPAPAVRAPAPVSKPLPYPDLSRPIPSVQTVNRAPAPVAMPARAPAPVMRPAPAPAPRPMPAPMPVVRAPAPVVMPGRTPSVQPPLMSRPAPRR